MFCIRFIEKVKTHILCSIDFFFFENRAVYEIMWGKKIIGPEMLHGSLIRCMRVAGWVTNVKETFRIRILRSKCGGTCAETRFRLSAKRTSPFKSAGASVQSTTGSRGVRISGSNAGYTVFRGIVKGTG